jgi:hypothetical protein
LMIVFRFLDMVYSGFAGNSTQDTVDSSH